MHNNITSSQVKGKTSRAIWFTQGYLVYCRFKLHGNLFIKKISSLSIYLVHWRFQLTGTYKNSIIYIHTRSYYSSGSFGGNLVLSTNGVYFRPMKRVRHNTLRGLNFAGIKFLGSLHPRNFDTVAGI